MQKEVYMPTSAVSTTNNHHDGVTLAPPFVSTTFRLPCPQCGHAVVFPWDPVLSAALDWDLVLCEEGQP
jgi:hypothetical protein